MPYLPSRNESKFFEVIFSTGLKVGLDAKDADAAETNSKKIFARHIPKGATIKSVTEKEKRTE
ncbi:MAG: hypothetical protein PHN88_14705 [Ignavibacteria bacterium]|nr:hypothetical protein [Ignavibacteria bacterium]